MRIQSIQANNPCLPSNPQNGEPPQISSWRELIASAGLGALLVVPTSRRRRMESVKEAVERQLLIQPRRATLAGLISELTGFCRKQFPLLGNVEQALRMARVLADFHHPMAPGLVQKLLDQRRLAQPNTGVDQPFAGVMAAYQKGLEADGVWDQVLQLENLGTELEDPSSPVSRFVGKTYQIALFDGFHSFSSAEAKVIAGLGKHIDVRLWMQGYPDQPWGQDTRQALDAIGVPESARFVESGVPSTNLARIGRSLFTGQAASPISESPQSLNLMEIGQKQEEFLEVANLLAQAFEKGDLANPGDIAIVVPGPTEARCCRLELERLAIPCNAPAEIIPLADSRPARVLLEALSLRHGKLSHAEAMGILLSPLVRAQLQNQESLSQLRKLGLGVQGQQTPEEWKQYWQDAIAKDVFTLRKRDDQADNIRDQGIKLKELATSAGHLLKRIVECLDFAGVIINDPGPALADRLARFLDLLKFHHSLDPQRLPELVEPREMQEDQLAWNNLQDMLRGIRDTPARRFPQQEDNKSWDWVGALRLGLLSETFALGAADHGKVQILRPLALRGSSFSVVIWVGLNQNEYPTQPSTDSLDDLETAKLLRDQQYLFGQAFEAAKDRFYLVRSQRNGDEHLQPGPFWNRVHQHLGSTLEIIKPKPGKCLVRPPKDRSVYNTIPGWIEYHHQKELLLDPRLTASILANIWNPEQGFSPTGLETYYKCPFRFFAETTLGLKAETEERLALEWGTVLHNALERATQPEQPLPHKEELLRETMNRALNERRRFLDPFHWHQVDRTIKLVTGEKIKTRLNGFLQHAAEVKIDHFLVGHDSKGLPVRINGRIDLVAIHQESKLISILDFKTGLIPKISEKVKSHRLLQPGLYALYVKEQDYGKEKEIAAAYIFVRKDYASVTGSLNFPGQIAKNAFPLDLVAEDGPQRAALNAAGEIRQGRISLTLYGPNKPGSECTSYCPGRHACRHPGLYKLA